MKNLIPISLIIFRLGLAPLIVGLAYCFGINAKLYIILFMYLGLLSDILDGIVARKLGVSSEKLRRFDSQTDLVFWLSIGLATWLLYPNIISENIYAVWIILGMEVSCYVISILKFGKETCTHAFLSKLWGITLLIAFTSLIGFNHAGFPFKLAIVMGLISHIDVILIILILPKWHHDIPSSYHAYLIRKGITFKRNTLLNDEVS
ncbi:CDP-alcohol phosphatidyltransferase family protein [Tenacibaculum jejuense]|uniref:CDP-alcohol phosphatidyltransferase n=1 Tax=Tenacibaculum jejuense TaxID=584609 RepID=A0A238UDE7_9FLAO|nr:CDP-alcohol phosphatidyltransferase family protein [Tenacibaculum jejuense]SNR17102.1 CDP-alcohol phosphatidyltransferase [Tenacibaculum jejuense]